MRSILLSAAAIIVFTLVLVVAQITSAPSAVSADPISETSAPPVVVAAVPTASEAEKLMPKAEANDSDYITTESGLKYRDIEEGTGDTPETRQLVSVHYTGTLPNGKVFDSSLKRGEPFTFPIGAGRVIKGWDEGVASMKVGGKRELVIPPDLAYGDRGIPGAIPPKSTLVFEVELLDIL
ncbi:MAG: FKBP-type peptidyl-prolyl cis-trans isomerase [Acaryochloridaceae cyanobacterium RL_2_7]|nr:FKBP-type peptidyl-prolyl cis-trans isomerase [Acaryochloridaceae cyanobacterium RL_2_7]